MKLSVIIITKNEQDMITDSLESVKFADEIIIVDTGNTDDTNNIAKKFGAKIIKSKGINYSDWRNTGLEFANGDWILFVDADERVSSQLKDEIMHIVSSSTSIGDPDYYLMPRNNNYLGKFMNYGGWGNERLPRLFKKSAISNYTGDLHEQPNVSGSKGTLKNFLIHYSHRDLESMVKKTIKFTDYEAKLRLNSGHPKIIVWRIIRVMFTEFWFRFVKNSAWRDGTEGVIDGLFQVYNSFIIYSRLWELQTIGNEKSINS